MYKLISITFIISFLGIGCSVLRKGSVPELYYKGDIQDSLVLTKVLGNNISQAGYFIKRADIEVITGDQRENIVGVVKFNKDGDYLISLKSKTGIEAARVFIGKDTVLINDRINRVLYVGSPKYIERRFSLTGVMFPMIFGDFVSMVSVEKKDSICIDGKLNYIYSSSNVRFSYEIDCILNKTLKANVETGANKRSVILLYSNFKKMGEFSYPGKIEVSGLPDLMVLKIEIKSIEVPWSGEMSFIPGNRYDIVNLK